jgi:hypothetical protein
MKRTFLLIACLGALILTACTSESSLPTPSGKGSIRALNAIPASPDIRFLIEERLIGAVGYNQSTSQNSFDDFEYNFNFEMSLPGSLQPDRVLTYAHKLETGRDDIFVLTGDAENPTVNVWSTPDRDWAETDTVLEIQFAHMILTQEGNNIDVYLDEAVTPAVAANKVATLSYGQVSDLSDFAEGNYTVTITTAGNIDDVLYQSSTIGFPSRTSQIVTAMAGDENDGSPVVVNILNDFGGDRVFPDADAEQTVRFFHAALALQATDIFDDDQLTSLKFSNLEYGNASGDIPMSTEVETFYYTPTGSTAIILHEADHQVPVGRHSNLYVIGPADDYSPYPFLPDRASVSLYAKVQLFNAALDTGAVDIYVKDADDPIVEEDRPTIFFLAYPSPSPIQNLNTGSYDVYVTLPAEKTPLADPLRLDIVDGDVVDLLLLDTDTPGVIEVKVIPAL